MRSEDAFELASDSFQCGTGTGVSSVGMEADTQHFPYFERVRQHEQFRFSVGRSSNRRTREPGVADLAGIRRSAAVARVAFGPGPTLNVPEAGGTDDLIVAGPN